VLAAAVAVSPSLAGSLLTSKRASHLFLTTKRASSTFLKKKTAGNTFLKKAEAPLVPVVGVAAGTAVFGPSTATAPGYIPTAFTSFATKAIGPAVITFSGSATCTAPKPTADIACPIQILVDGQATGKINFAPATAETPAPAAIAETVTLTTVLLKGGHTIAVQYAGSSKATFTLKGWNLAVQAYPEAEEPLETSGEKTVGK